jgi:hypothetical protein
MPMRPTCSSESAPTSWTDPCHLTRGRSGGGSAHSGIFLALSSQFRGTGVTRGAPADGSRSSCRSAPCRGDVCVLRKVSLPPTGTAASLPLCGHLRPRSDLRDQGWRPGVVEVGIADEDDHVTGTDEMGGSAVTPTTREPDNRLNRRPEAALSALSALSAARRASGHDGS